MSVSLVHAQRAAGLALASTVVVVVVKLAAAWMSGSISVLAEGLQSILDIAMSLIALLAVRYAAKPPDKDHPYGHGKAELLSSAFQMLVILGSGVYILVEAGLRFMHPRPIDWDWGAAAMLYTVIANSLVGAYVSRVARDTHSAVLASEALHLRGDTLSSGGVLIGMWMVGLTGQSLLDPVFAILFTLITMGLAIRRLGSVLHPLMDGALPIDDLHRLEELLNRHPEVRGYHNLTSRTVGSMRFVEVHVMLDDHLTFVRAHEVTEQIEAELREALGGARVSIHYEPYEAEVEHRRREHRMG